MSRFIFSENKDFFIILFTIIAGWYTLFGDMKDISKDMRDISKEMRMMQNDFNKIVIKQNEKIDELRQDFLLLRFDKVKKKNEVENG